MKKLIDKEIIEMYTKEKIPQTVIAKNLGVDVRRIRKILTDNNIEIFNPKKGKIFIPENIQKQVVELYLEGFVYTDIKEKLNIGERSIAKILDSKGIIRRRPSEYTRKYTADYTFFDKIDNEYKAYWLGFLYADGYISEKDKNNSAHVSLYLKDEDEQHIELFKRVMRAENPLEHRDYTTPLGKKNRSCGITIRHEHLVNSLIDKGCVNNKSLILTFPTREQVPEVYVSHFIRGYFDGDGCISKTKNNRFSFQMCGTYEFLTGVLDFLGVSQKLHQGKNKEKNNYSFIIKGNKQIERLMRILYNDSHIFLKRKAILFLELQLENTFNHV